MRAMTYSAWERRYRPFESWRLGDTSMGDVMVPYEVAKDRKPELVWTVVEGDNGKLYLTPGFHFVNRVGYVVCEVAHDNPDRVAAFW